MINFKKFIKKYVQKLPLGDKYLLHIARYIARYLFLYQLNKWMVEKREAYYILKRLEMNNFDEAVIIYDMKVSPPTYGDCFYVVMVARFFMIMGKKVNFFIINSDFGENVLGAYSEEECNNLVDRLLEVPKVLLKGGACNIQILPWYEYSKAIRNFNNEKRTLIVFKKAVESRDPIYFHCFNLVNRLASSFDNNQINNFLISKEEITTKVEIKYPQTPYITMGARYSIKWGHDRNITEEEFLKIFRLLRSQYPNHAIMIVSDEIGCAYFKKLAQENNLQCLFSKDFSKTFMGDCALVINSAYYFQLRGGGISLAATYSFLPHLIVAETIHETIQRKKGLAVWARKDQIWKTGTKGLPEDILLTK